MNPTLLVRVTKLRILSAWTLACFCCGAGAIRLAASPADDVRTAEAAFAATMASRDFDRFAEFVSPESIFFTHGKVLRGKLAVLGEWKVFFEKPEPPFSWKPEEIEVLDTGGLALSSGPIFDQGGKLVARFTSIWRLESDGKWRVVFDKGNRVCE